MTRTGYALQEPAGGWGRVAHGALCDIGIRLEESEGLAGHRDGLSPHTHIADPATHLVHSVFILPVSCLTGPRKVCTVGISIIYMERLRPREGE